MDNMNHKENRQLASIWKKLILIENTMGFVGKYLNTQKPKWPWALVMIVLILSVPDWGQGAGICPPGTAPNSLVYSDSAEEGHPNKPFAVIVDKSRQQLVLYRHKERWQEVARWSCSTGKHAGPKKKEGDKKTPEGIYFVTRKVGQRYLTATYGSQALPLDYPNWLDKQQRRTGSAIWLHGTNKPLQARDSNGCVVLENSAIELLARHIRLNRTPVIIVDRIQTYPVGLATEFAARILAAGDKWHAAMMHGSYHDFSKCYTSGAAPGMKWWQLWCRQRREHGMDASMYRSVMDQRAIYRSGKVYVLLFDQILKSPTRSIRVGRRKLYLSMEEDRVRIVGETYQFTESGTKDPLLTAWYQLWKTSEGHRKMAAKVKNGGES